MEQRRQKMPDPAVSDQGVISDTLASLLVTGNRAVSMDSKAAGGKQQF
jgi:hypothetical protein